MPKLPTRITLIIALVVGSVAHTAAAKQQAATSAARPGWLGVSIQDLTGEIRETLPRGVTEGAIVTGVMKDSPASGTRLAEGDIITRFNRTRIQRSDDLTRAASDAGAGRTVELEYYRNGRLFRDRVTLGARGEAPAAERSERDRLREYVTDDDEREDEVRAFGRAHDPRAIILQMNRRGRLGVRLMDLGPQLASYFKVEPDGGALITEVIEESPAARAGLKAGDVIIRMDGQTVSDAGDVSDRVRQFREGGAFDIEVKRNGQARTFSVTLKKAEREFGMRAPRMRRFHLGPDDEFEFAPLPELSWRPGERRNQEELKRQMDDLREQLEQLRRELSDLRSKRP